MAVTTQEPTPIPVTVPLLLTVQMLVAVLLLKVTGLPDAPPVALDVVVPPTATVLGEKLMMLMVWLPCPTVKF